MTEIESPAGLPSAESTQMLTALVRMRSALQDVRLPLELPSAPDNRDAQRRWLTSSRTT